MQLDLNNLNEEEKEVIFKIGVLKIAESIFEGVPSIERFSKNLNSLKDKTGYSYEDIWQAYEFLSQSVISLGKPKDRPSLGFIRKK